MKDTKCGNDACANVHSEHDIISVDGQRYNSNDDFISLKNYFQACFTKAQRAMGHMLAQGHFLYGEGNSQVLFSDLQILLTSFHALMLVIVFSDGV